MINKGLDNKLLFKISFYFENKRLFSLHKGKKKQVDLEDSLGKGICQVFLCLH